MEPSAFQIRPRQTTPETETRSFGVSAFRRLLQERKAQRGNQPTTLSSPLLSRPWHASSFLHRAALAFTKEALGSAYLPRPFSGLFLASARPSPAGHLGLGLARASPVLRDDLLTPGAFLLDATHVLGAVALRRSPQTQTGAGNRMFWDDIFPGELARAEAQGGAQAAEALRIFKALVDAQDCRLLDVLDALARLAAELPDSNSPRLCAAAVCDLLGRVDEGDRWLAGIHCPLDHSFFNLALVAATLGGGPGAVAGSQSRVASAALRIINTSVSDGQMSAFETIIIGLLKHAAKRRCEDPPLEHGDGVLRELADAFALSGSIPKGRRLFALEASQALLSAVVLRAHTLSGERVSTALRVAERDLARAAELGDAAAVADLRLLLAFLAARAGRFDEALARYQEVARDDPSDPRPHFLAVLICVHASRPK